MALETVDLGPLESDDVEIAGANRKGLLHL
jgi:hypothetical protein